MSFVKKEDLGNDVSHFNPWEGCGATSRHVKDGNITVNSQHGLTNGKLCLLQ